MRSQLESHGEDPLQELLRQNDRGPMRPGEPHSRGDLPVHANVEDQKGRAGSRPGREGRVTGGPTGCTAGEPGSEAGGRHQRWHRGRGAWRRWRRGSGAILRAGLTRAWGSLREEPGPNTAGAAGRSLAGRGRSAAGAGWHGPWPTGPPRWVPAAVDQGHHGPRFPGGAHWGSPRGGEPPSLL